MDYISYARSILLFSITFYVFTPGILFTLPQGSSKKVVALVHTLMWTASMCLISILESGFVNGLSIIFVVLCSLLFYVFTPDIVFYLPPNGSKEVVAGTHSLLFAISSILFDRVLIRMIS